MGFDMKRCLAAAAAAVLTIAFIGCDRGEMNGEPVDYGPAQDPKAISVEVANLVRDSDPSQTKVGAFGRFLTTDNIGGGTLVQISANTSQEVISRTVKDNVLNMQIAENVTEYHSNSTTPQKLSRIFQFNFALPTPTATPTPSPAPAMPLSASAAQQIADTDIQQGLHAFFVRTGDARAAAANANVTFHGLRAWEDSGPPPERVRSAPNCLGIPQCQIRLRHVVFDIVSWEIPEGNRVHIELVTSPDVPQTIGLNMSPIRDIWQYIPGLMKTCISFMVAVGTDGRNKTLITECKEVVNFAYDASQFVDPDQATP